MEDKKKVIVPIIIGVTVLLVLIVGATYAYFQATNSASGTTSVEASTEKIGTVIVSNPTENLYLKLSAYDMQESMKGTSYYATNDSSKSYETELSNYTISEYSITGGEEDTVYNCTYKLNITKPSQIIAGDMRLKLQLNGATIDGNSVLDVDLANVSSSYTVSFSATGNTSGTLVTGGIVFNNTTSEQNHLVGQTLSTVITNSDLDCNVGETIALEPGLYKRDGTFVSWDELLTTRTTIFNPYLEEEQEVNILKFENGKLSSNFFTNDNYWYESGALGYSGYSNGNLVLPDSVKEIEAGTFMGEGLSSIYIPDSVEIINAYTDLGYDAHYQIVRAIDSANIYCESTSQKEGWDEYWNVKGYYDEELGEFYQTGTINTNYGITLSEYKNLIFN